MTAKIDYSDFTTALRRLDHVDTELQKELVETYHDSAPKILAEMRGAAFTPIQRHAVSTVRITRDRDGITIRGGGGGGLGGTLFAGGEFGGRKSRKKTYSRRSPKGYAHVVRRRTTMQFLPHLGKEGYFFYPTVREWLPKLYKLQQEVVERMLGGRS